MSHWKVLKYFRAPCSLALFLFNLLFCSYDSMHHLYIDIHPCVTDIHVYSRMLNVQILSAMECIVWGSFSPKFMLKFKILMINHYKLCFYYLQINALCVLFFISKSFFLFLLPCALRVTLKRYDSNRNCMHWNCMNCIFDHFDSMFSCFVLEEC